MAETTMNYFLINAPAGSGKTTQIKAMIQKFILEDQKNNILCITYTNRAAEELSKDIISDNVFIGTIHSFLHKFMKNYFSHNEIINLYFEIYGDKIKERISNIDKQENIVASNDRYIEKYGSLSYEIVSENIKSVSYNESPFNSLYYGGLSHDDLISFSKCIFDRFLIIQKRIAFKYQFIFIDEYQDTMADVLKIFYECIAKTNTRLYLYGDRMQQIYDNYDGTFEEQFKAFDNKQALTINYRSTTDIVNILNKIYNNSSFIQDNSSEMKKVSANYRPRIIITSDIESSINEIKATNPDIMTLYLLNRQRFSDIGALSLYKAFEGMEKYGYGRTYTVVNILTTAYIDNPDPLMKLMFCIMYLVDCYQARKYGLIVQTLKAYKMFCSDVWQIRSHGEKQKLIDNLKNLFNVLKSDSAVIGDLLNKLDELFFIDKTFLDGILSDDENQNALKVPLIELRRLTEYLSNPKISTQHGVKGESHNSVIFVADDSTRSPIVHMYKFFEMWGHLSISLETFNQFYYSYANELLDLWASIKINNNDLNKDSYSEYSEIIYKKLLFITEKFSNDSYFKFLCKENYDKYFNKPGVTNAKNCLKESTVLGVLSAYKLFYVGCSRARRNLTIIIDSLKLKGDVNIHKKKFIEIGFEVIDANFSEH